MAGNIKGITIELNGDTTKLDKALRNVTDHYGIDPGKPADFIVMDAENYYDALNRNASVLYSFRNGRIIKTKEIR